MAVKMFAFLILMMVSVDMLMATRLASGYEGEFQPERLAQSFAKLNDKLDEEVFSRLTVKLFGVRYNLFYFVEKTVKKVMSKYNDLQYVGDFFIKFTFVEPKCDFNDVENLRHIYHGVFANESALFLKQQLNKRNRIEYHLSKCDPKKYEVSLRHSIIKFSKRNPPYYPYLAKSFDSYVDLNYSDYEFPSPLKNKDSLKILSDQIKKRARGNKIKAADVKAEIDECKEIIRGCEPAFEIQSCLAKMVGEGSEIDFVKLQTDYYKAVLYTFHYCRALVKDCDGIENPENQILETLPSLSQ